jgi:excinuclease UvrABC ATPase subunit
MAENDEKKKSRIQELIDLMEDKGYHVYRAQEETHRSENMAENDEKKKSRIQELIDLLEDNGYHVSRIEEELIGHGMAEGMPSGAIKLRIARL